jgi:predicted CoA-binding protein
MAKPPSTFDILKKYKRVAVVGISANPDRPSHWIARYLIDNGFEVTGVNPGLPKIEGIRVVASLKDVPGPLEIVDVFRSPDAIPDLVREAVPLKPAVFWLQPGAENPEAAAEARAQGLTVISGECIYADHRVMRAMGES